MIGIGYKLRFKKNKFGYSEFIHDETARKNVGKKADKRAHKLSG